MLEADLKFKKAFTRMEKNEDKPFICYFNEPEPKYDEDGEIVVSTKKSGNRIGSSEEED